MIVAIATPRVVCSVGLKNISRYFRLPSFTPSSSDSYAMRAKSSRSITVEFTSRKISRNS